RHAVDRLPGRVDDRVALTRILERREGAVLRVHDLVLGGEARAQRRIDQRSERVDDLVQREPHDPLGRGQARAEAGRVRAARARAVHPRARNGRSGCAARAGARTAGASRHTDTSTPLTRTAGARKRAISARGQGRSAAPAEIEARLLRGGAAAESAQRSRTDGSHRGQGKGGERASSTTFHRRPPRAPVERGTPGSGSDLTFPSVKNERPVLVGAAEKFSNQLRTRRRASGTKRLPLSRPVSRAPRGPRARGRSARRARLASVPRGDCVPGEDAYVASLARGVRRPWGRSRGKSRR